MILTNSSFACSAPPRESYEAFLECRGSEIELQNMDAEAAGGTCRRGLLKRCILFSSRECRWEPWERCALARRFLATRQAGAWRSQEGGAAGLMI
jgi:hypothetical protein